MRCPATCVHRVPGSWRFECARGRGKPAVFFNLSRSPQQLSIKVVAWKSLQLLYSNQISSWKLWHLQKEIALPTLSWLNENDCFQLAYLDFGCHKMLFDTHPHGCPKLPEGMVIASTNTTMGPAPAPGTGPLDARWPQWQHFGQQRECLPPVGFCGRLAGNIFRGVWGNKQKQANISPLCSNHFCKWFWSGFWVPKHLLTGYLEH